MLGKIGIVFCRTNIKPILYEARFELLRYSQKRIIVHEITVWCEI